jgi:hypothetical protein
MAADLPEALLRQLIPAQVRWFAVQAGWRPVEGVKRPVIVLSHPTDDLAQLQIPIAGSDRERAFLMGEAVRQLAVSQKRSAGELLNDLAMPPSDVLRLQMESRDAESGTLPLEEGLRLLEGGRDLLMAAACSAHHPQAYFPRQSYAPAQDFLRSCRVGQTERGSFVATILAPVTPEVAPSLFDNGQEAFDLFQEPYERRVTPLLGVSQGVSANLCEALGAMGPFDLTAALRIGISWSPNRRRVPVAIHQLAFSHAELPFVREVGRRLRERIEPHRERVEGPVVSLHAEPAQLFEQFKGRVVIRALIAGRTERVRFLLSQAEYGLACDAHRDHHRVGVEGVLKRDAQAKMFDLLQPQDFRVLGD